MVDRVKPLCMVYGSGFRVLFMVLFMVQCMVWCMVWCMVHSNILICKGLLLWTVDMGWLRISNFLWYPMFFLSPGMTWNTLLTLRSTWGFYLNHVNQSLSLRLIECALHYALLEHGELLCVLPFDVHLDLGHLPDIQGYLGLCTPVTFTQAHWM